MKLIMYNHQADLYHLILQIQRLLDAEMLGEPEGESLLAKTEAVHRSLELGDAKTARSSLEQIAHTLEALVKNKTLAPIEGCTVLKTAHCLLSKTADSTIEMDITAKE